MREPNLSWERTIQADAKSVSVKVARSLPPCSTRMEFVGQDCYPPFANLHRYWRIEGFQPLLVRVEERLRADQHALPLRPKG